MYVKDGVDRAFKEFPYCNHIPKGADYPRVGNYCSLKALENVSFDFDLNPCDLHYFRQRITSLQETRSFAINSLSVTVSSSKRGVHSSKNIDFTMRAHPIMPINPYFPPIDNSVFLLPPIEHHVSITLYSCMLFLY